MNISIKDKYPSMPLLEEMAERWLNILLLETVKTQVRITKHYKNKK